MGTWVIAGKLQTLANYERMKHLKEVWYEDMTAIRKGGLNDAEREQAAERVRWVEEEVKAIRARNPEWNPPPAK